MQIGSHGYDHGAAHRQLSDRAQMMQREMASDKPTRGERAVARLDKDDDGAISIAELKDTKFGRKISVDRFARMDANSDGRLEAGELDAGKRRGHDHKSGSAQMESVITAKYADFLTEQVKPQETTPDVAALVLEKLDGDQSGGLNSEEIAGTRLAEIIGGDFYQIDADKDGALNKAELAGFVTEHLLGSAQDNVQDTGEVIGPDTDETAEILETADTGVGGIPADDTSTGEVVASPSETADIVTPAASGEPSAAAIQAQNVATAFETALEILKSGTGGENPYDVVSALYGDVQKILQSG